MKLWFVTFLISLLCVQYMLCAQGQPQELNGHVPRAAVHIAGAQQQCYQQCCRWACVGCGVCLVLCSCSDSGFQDSSGSFKIKSKIHQAQLLAQQEQLERQQKASKFYADLDRDASGCKRLKESLTTPGAGLPQMQ